MARASRSTTLDVPVACWSCCCRPVNSAATSVLGSDAANAAGVRPRRSKQRSMTSAAGLASSTATVFALPTATAMCSGVLSTGSAVGTACASSNTCAPNKQHKQHTRPPSPAGQPTTRFTPLLTEAHVTYLDAPRTTVIRGAGQIGRNEQRGHTAVVDSIGGRAGLQQELHHLPMTTFGSLLALVEGKPSASTAWLRYNKQLPVPASAACRH